jgi:hypothetical protein
MLPDAALGGRFSFRNPCLFRRNLSEAVFEFDPAGLILITNRRAVAEPEGMSCSCQQFRTGMLGLLADRAEVISGR